MSNDTPVPVQVGTILHRNREADLAFDSKQKQTATRIAILSMVANDSLVQKQRKRASCSLQCGQKRGAALLDRVPLSGHRRILSAPIPKLQPVNEKRRCESILPSQQLQTSQACCVARQGKHEAALLLVYRQERVLEGLVLVLLHTRDQNGKRDESIRSANKQLGRAR